MKGLHNFEGRQKGFWRWRLISVHILRIKILEGRGNAFEEAPRELDDKGTDKVCVLPFRRVLEIEIEISKCEGRVESAFTLDGFDDGRATHVYRQLNDLIFLGHEQAYHNMLFPLPAAFFVREA